MQAARPQVRKYTLEEYFEMEEKSQEKHNYYNGYIEPIMAGGTVNHNEICANIISSLVNAKRTKSLAIKVYTSDMKVWVPIIEKVFYPYALVISNQPQFHNSRKDIITNPIVIVEVFSASSEQHDRYGKFNDYRLIPSFQEYLLLHQDRAAASLYRREGEDLWRTVDVSGLDASITLQSIGVSIALQDIYYQIDFTEAG